MNVVQKNTQARRKRPWKMSNTNEYMFRSTVPGGKEKAIRVVIHHPVSLQTIIFPGTYPM